MGRVTRSPSPPDPHDKRPALDAGASSSPGTLRQSRFETIWEWTPLAVLVPSILLEMVVDPLENLHILDSLKALFFHAVAIFGVCGAVLLLISQTFFLKKLFFPLLTGLLLVVLSLAVQVPHLQSMFFFKESPMLEVVIKRSCLWGGLGLLIVGLFLAALEVRRMHLRLIQEAEELDREVQERRRIEQELRASEQKSGAVLDTSVDGFVTVDKEGRIREVNDAYVRLSGYSREELLSMGIEDLEAGESLAQIKAHCQEIRESGNKVFETIHRTKSGTLCQLEISASFCPLEEGLFFAFARDIRQRKRSDSLLRERLELSTLADHASLDELVQAALVAAEIHTGSRISFFHFIDPDQENVSLQTWSPNTLDGRCMLEVKKKHYPISQAGVWVDCFHALEPVIHNDYNALPHRKGLPQGHAPIIREMAVPILREGRVIAILGVGNKLVDYTQDDVEVVKIIASFALDLVTAKQAKDALRLSEERFRTLVETTFDTVWEIDTEARMTYASPRTEDILGYKPEEVVGLKFYSFMPPEEAHKFKEFYAGLIKEPRPIVRLESRNQHRDGHWLIFETSGVPIYGIDGEFLGYRGVNRDITERKQAETALRQSEEKYRTLVETNYDWIWEVDAEGRYTYSSPKGEVFLGYPTSEILGSTPFKFMSEDEAERIKPIFLDLACKREPVIALENVNYHRDGRLVTLETTAVPVFGNDGTFLGYRGTDRDITERKQAETALRQSEQKFRALVETTFDLVWEVDVNGKIIYVSPRMKDLLGYTPEEAIGQTPFDFMPEDEARRVRKIFQEIAEARQPFSGLENVNRHRDGHLVVLETSGVPFFGINGEFLGYHGTDRDITERKQAEEDRLEMERRLLHAQKLESLGVLAGGIAHDFNNLLMAILGNLELVLLEMTSAHSARAGIEQAIQATRRATDLTRQMLAYSGRGRFMVSRIDLSALVRENAELFRAAITRTVSLNVSLSPRGSTIEADPGQIQQVIMNLLTNAVEAMEGRTGVVTLTTGIEEYDETELAQSRLDEKPEPGLFTYLEVSDMGCGMNAQTQQRLFDPFFTTKFTGRGLGMSALLGIVRGHKGAIFVDSELGVGTTIRVLFPTCEAAPDVPEIEPPTPPPGLEQKLPSSRVLVVDDDETVRHLCQKLVKRLGHEVLCAADGEEAIKLFKEEGDTIACVLLDLTMPRLDGLSTFRALKDLKQDVRVILSSGYSEHESITRFSGEGLAGFLQKPFNLRELEKRLTEVMGRQA